MRRPFGTQAAESGAPLSHADLVRQATQQSAAGHKVEALPDGRARIPSPMQAIEAEAGALGITVRSTAKNEAGSFTLQARTLGRNGSAAAIPAGDVRVEGATVQIIHPNLIEELTTSADGVRQDFISPCPQEPPETAAKWSSPSPCRGRSWRRRARR